MNAKRAAAIVAIAAILAVSVLPVLAFGASAQQSGPVATAQPGSPIFVYVEPPKLTQAPAPTVTVEMKPVVSQGDPGYAGAARDYVPLVDSLVKVAGAIILGLWALFRQRLNMSDSCRARVDAMLPQALSFAEAQLGKKLDASHLNDVVSRNTVLQHAADFMADHAPQAIRKLKLDDPQMQAKLLAALANKVGSTA